MLATCNRVEIYADVDRFHGSVEAVSRLLCELADEAPEDVVPHLYVHYDDGAVSHLFHVAAGLDSMVVGEGQILGQAREALRIGQEAGTVGPALNVLFQQALRVGKRAHAETDIDRAAPSLVGVALDQRRRGGRPAGGPARAGRRRRLDGRSLAVATVSRLGAAEIVVANRTEAHARRLAEQYDGRAVPLDPVQEALAEADVLISCTGATGVVLPLSVVAAARLDADRPLAVIDLALPHDVDPAVAELPGVTLLDLARLAAVVHEGDGGADVGRGPRDRRRGDRRLPRGPRARRRSPPRWSRSARWPPASSTPSCSGWPPGCPSSTPRSAPRSSTPYAGSPTSCCTSRRSGSRSSPTRPGRCPTPPRSRSCSPSTPTPSRR